MNNAINIAVKIMIGTLQFALRKVDIYLFIIHHFGLGSNFLLHENYLYYCYSCKRIFIFLKSPLPRTGNEPQS